MTELDEFEKLATRVLWHPMETAPKDRFVFLYCPEDNSRWFAKWQGGRWHGVDDEGLTREGYHEDAVTGWEVTAWMPLPDPPFVDAG